MNRFSTFYRLVVYRCTNYSACLFIEYGAAYPKIIHAMRQQEASARYCHLPSLFPTTKKKNTKKKHNQVSFRCFINKKRGNAPCKIGPPWNAHGAHTWHSTTYCLSQGRDWTNRNRHRCCAESTAAEWSWFVRELQPWQFPAETMPVDA